MVKQVQAERNTAREEKFEAPEALQSEAEVAENARARKEQLVEADNIMDEIDAVLEENAEQFFDSYQQQGGQ